MASSVQVNIDGEQLCIINSDFHDLTIGRHRIFFSSVIGMALSDEWQGYSGSITSSTPKLLEEVTKYLERSHLPYELSLSASTLLSYRKDASSALNEARILGNQIHDGIIPPLNIPKSFSRILKPYQVPAVSHMLSMKHSANFSVPGSGKTTMVLAVFAQLRAEGKINKLFVVGPRSCFMPWADEFKGCFGREPNLVRITGTPENRSQKYLDFGRTDTEIALVTYQTAANDAEKIIEILQQDRVMLVLDESHYIKRMTGGVWSKALLDIAPYAEKRVILSGTPAPNGLEDLWSQITFLWPNPPALGSRERYQSKTANLQKATVQIQTELRPFFWRVKKSDVALPKPIFHPILIELKPYQAAIYRALSAKVLSDVVHSPSDRIKLRQWRKAKMVRMLQAASNPSLLSKFSPEFQIPPLSAAGLSVEEIIENYGKYEYPSKLLFARELVTELIGKGFKVVLWSSFINNIQVLAEDLKKFKPQIVHGGIARDANEDLDVNRELAISRFKDPTNFDYPLLIANPGACAESISLHRVCKHAIYLDRTFNGAQYMQSLDRLHRLGLDDSDEVHYYLLMAKGTIDEVIDSRLKEKQLRLEQLLNDDLSVVDLEQDGISEDSEETSDFDALIQHLKEKTGL